MSEEKNDKSDVVNREDYNKVIEAHNSIKLEKEKLEKELNESKVKLQVSEEKSKWEQETKQLNEKISELDKKIEEKKAVAKSVIQEPINKDARIMENIDKILPKEKANPKEFASNLARYMHYKSPMTKFFNNQHFGKALDLHDAAIISNPNILPMADRPPVEIRIPAKK